MRKSIIYLLCGCFAASSLAGCSKNSEAAFDPDAVVMTINDEEVSAGVVKFAVHYSQAMYQEMYEYYFGDNPFSYAYSDDYTIGDMMVEGAVESFHEMILARQHMEEFDVELTEDEEAAIEEAASAFIEANDEETLEAISATQEIVEEYLTLITIQNKMESDPMVADVDTEVSDEEAAQRCVDYVFVAMETEDETEEETEIIEVETDEESETAILTGTTTVKTTSSDETESETIAETGLIETEAETENIDETEAVETESETESETETETEDPDVTAAMEEAYAKAEEIIALVEDGTELSDAAASVDEDLTVNEITFGADSTEVSENLITATEDVSDDTLITYPIEGESGYYVAYVVSEFDEDATEEEKENIVEERKEEAIEELYSEWEEDSEIETDEDVLATISIDINLYLEEETETEEITEVETETISEKESDTEEVSEAESDTGTESEIVTDSESELDTESDTNS